MKYTGAYHQANYNHGKIKTVKLRKYTYVKYRHLFYTVLRLAINVGKLVKGFIKKTRN
jgi:hypothetical protein